MKAKLQNIKGEGTNAYSHLVSVLSKLVLQNDRNGYDLFQYYSQTIKNPNIAQSNVQINQDVLLQQAQKFKKLLNKPNVGTQQQPQQPGPCGYLPNLIEQAKLFQKAGVGFGQQLTFLIFKAIQRLCVTKPYKQVKFWGKITAKQNDYYIVQVAGEGGEQGQLPPQVQPKGQGVNKMSYLVCTNLLSGEWKQLPLITPQQLIISRRIKYIFSGDIDKPVFTNPHFKGKEGHLLKCQIVRINFSCQIVPRTMFNVNAEDKKQIQPAGEEWKLPNFQFLSQLQNWVHHPQNILKNGRLTLLKPVIPQGVEVDQEKLMKQLEAKDPLQQRLKSISKDNLNGQPAWIIRSVGDCSQYKAIGKGKQTINYGFIVLRSLVWRGYVLVYHNKQWSSIYVGQGLKTSKEWYFPRQPENVLNQPQIQRKQVAEPNFPAEQIKPKVQQ